MMNEPRTIKIEMALSPETDVFLIFNGTAPDRACFQRLRKLIDLTEESFVSQPVKTAPRRILRCLKHPLAVRSAGNNRCLECLREAGRHMVAVRKERRATA